MPYAEVVFAYGVWTAMVWLNNSNRGRVEQRVAEVLLYVPQAGSTLQ